MLKITFSLHPNIKNQNG